jgi:hypothetical protein
MATEKQIAANRANAKHSTGPKTKLGRCVSSHNALRHGLACPTRDEAVLRDIDHLTRTLAQDGTNDDQLAAARQVALAQIDLLRVRMVRATLLASVNLEGCSCNGLKRLIALDRYERIARAKRRMAANKLRAS